MHHEIALQKSSTITLIDSVDKCIEISPCVSPEQLKFTRFCNLNYLF